MHVRHCVPLLLLAGGCASSPAVKDGARHAFVHRPSRPPDCDFEVFEERNPTRPFTVLGVLPLEGNEWLGTRGRKALLQEPACRAGADAVLLGRPAERRVANQHVRQYEARFIAYTDVPAPVDPDAEPPPLPLPERTEPLEEGVILVPAGPEWPEESIGTAVREVKPGEKP